jgi:hypothetical protein
VHRRVAAEAVLRPAVVEAVDRRAAVAVAVDRRGAAVAEVAAVLATGICRSVLRQEAACARGSVRSVVQAPCLAAGSCGLRGPGVGCPCPADRAPRDVAAAAAWSPARFCLIEPETSRQSGRVAKYSRSEVPRHGCSSYAVSGRGAPKPSWTRAGQAI